MVCDSRGHAHRYLIAGSAGAASASDDAGGRRGGRVSQAHHTVTRAPPIGHHTDMPFQCQLRKRIAVAAAKNTAATALTIRYHGGRPRPSQAMVSTGVDGGACWPCAV